MRIPLVDGLRGIAILMVIWHHLAGESSRVPLSLGPFSLPNNPLLANGWMGVNLFFFLSGLVLYLPYAAGQRAMITGADVSGFLHHRARRLLPLFYISMIVGFVLLARLNELQNWKSFAASLTLAFPFYAPAFGPPGNWVLWSLGTEIWFCFAMPLLVIAIARFGMLRVVLASVLIALPVRIAGFVLIEADGNYVNAISDTVFGRLDDFVMGMCAARLLVHRVRLPLSWLPLGIVALFAAPVLSDAWFAGQVPGWAQAFTYSLINFGLLTTIGVLLLRDNVVTRLLLLPPLRVAGMMCFSIYVWHGIVLRKFQQQLPMADWLGDGPLWPVLLYVATVLLLAGFSYVFIEFPGQPIRRLFAMDLARTAVSPR